GQTRRGDAAGERHEDQRRAKTGEAARGPRHERDRADRDRGSRADLRRDQAGKHHAPKKPSVLLAPAATHFAPTPPISPSVIVFSRGCMVTAMATDFLASSMPLPWYTSKTLTSVISFLSTPCAAPTMSPAITARSTMKAKSRDTGWNAERSSSGLARV